MEWTPEADAILREHHALGSSQKVTAQAIGGDCQQNDVSRRMKRLGMLARTQSSRQPTTKPANASHTNAGCWQPKPSQTPSTSANASGTPTTSS